MFCGTLRKRYFFVQCIFKGKTLFFFYSLTVYFKPVFGYCLGGEFSIGKISPKIVRGLENHWPLLTEIYWSCARSGVFL